MPLPLQLNEWMLDASTSGLDLKTCRLLNSALVSMVQGNAHLGDDMWALVAVLSKLLDNIVSCGNSLPKYRAIKKSNPKIEAMLSILAGCDRVLVLVGFKEDREAFTFPEGDGPDVLGRVSLVSSKLVGLLAHKGFTGMARDSDDTGSTAASKWAGTPGFRWQREIFECSACARPINDGSERLFSRRHDAPKGEFRYQCETCGSFNLCEACWDRFVSGELKHPEQHSFRHHHPRASQHYMYSQETDANPWGKFAGGSCVARARERLKARTGL